MSDAREMLDKIIARASCRCDRHPGHPCATLATQEDMLCDACRDTAEKDSAGEDGVSVRIAFGCSVVFLQGSPCPGHVSPLPFTPRV